jgi:hypothetical protein
MGRGAREGFHRESFVRFDAFAVHDANENDCQCGGCQRRLDYYVYVSRNPSC